jgi:thioredoxin-related protein
MPRTQLLATTVAALSVLALAPAASAQDVKWRHDYAAARKEATETGRPLLLGFGTEACFWCKKLDGTTLRDPAVVALLNEKFIPVKVDGGKNPRMTEALGIDGFPTLIVATPDGKVVGRHPGYADAAQMTTLLGKAPAPTAVAPEVVNPRTTEQQLDADLAALHAKLAAALDR